jgi:hypothetical protein
MKNKLILLILISFFFCVLMYLYFYTEQYIDKKEDTYTYTYIKDFLSNEDFLKIKNECDKYTLLLNENGDENSYTNQRKNIKLSNDKIKEILDKKEYQEKLRSVTNNSNIYLSHNFPIEYRKYEKGSFMKRHSDTLIYRIPQYECVYTLFNDSDTKTVFYDKDNNIIETLQTTPNSLVILKANGIEHEVLPVTKGERFFLKFIFTETDEFSF